MTAGAAVREDVRFQSGAVRCAAWLYRPESVPAPLVVIRVAFYSPARELRRARCPVLVCVFEHDTVAPAGPTIRAAQHAPTAELIRYPIGHFDIYVGDGFERSSSDQLAFLRRHLGLSDG